jgi:hypothetical protein
MELGEQAKIIIKKSAKRKRPASLGAGLLDFCCFGFWLKPKPFSWWDNNLRVVVVPVGFRLFCF